MPTNSHRNSPSWMPGTRLQFRWPCPAEETLVVEYLGPGWGPQVFAGRIVASASAAPGQQVGTEANDWARNAFEPVPAPESPALTLNTEAATLAV